MALDLKKEIFKIEKNILPEADIHDDFAFLIKDLSPIERLVKYSENPKTCFKYICALNPKISFESNAVYVTLTPKEREELLNTSKEMFNHGKTTGRFKGSIKNETPADTKNRRVLADIVKGNTGEQAGINLLNAAFKSFGLETKLEINKLKYDGRGDGGRDAVIGLYGIDFKYRNDVNEFTDLVVSSFEPSPYSMLVHTHSVRRKDDRNYTDDYYLNVRDSSHIVVIRGCISGATFSHKAGKFANGRYVLDNSRSNLIPVWDMVLFLAIQAAKQEGVIQ